MTSLFALIFLGYACATIFFSGASRQEQGHLKNFFWSAGSYFLDVHPSFSRSQQYATLISTIDENRAIKFLDNFHSFFHQHTQHLLALRPSLLSNEIHSKNIFCVLTHFFKPPTNLDSSTFATSSCMDLGLNHPGTLTQLPSCIERALLRSCNRALQHWNYIYVIDLPSFKYKFVNV